MWLVLAFLGVFAGSAQSFQLVGASDVVVDVTIDGSGPYRFLLDTGSSRSAISESLMARLGAKPSARTMMVTPSGAGIRPVVELHDLGVGPCLVPTVAAMVLPAPDLGVGIDGLIGQDVLADRIYTVDYERRMIVWHATLPADLRGSRLPLEINEGLVVVSLAQKSSRQGALQFIPDSGTDTWILFSRAGRRLPDITPLETAALRTLSGRRLVRSVLIDDLAVGAIRLRDQLAVLIETGDSEESFTDGLLPLHHFARVTFDGPGRALIIESR